MEGILKNVNFKKNSSIKLFIPKEEMEAEKIIQLSEITTMKMENNLLEVENPKVSIDSDFIKLTITVNNPQ